MPYSKYRRRGHRVFLACTGKMKEMNVILLIILWPCKKYFAQRKLIMMIETINNEYELLRCTGAIARRNRLHFHLLSKSCPHLTSSAHRRPQKTILSSKRLSLLLIVVHNKRRVHNNKNSGSVIAAQRLQRRSESPTHEDSAGPVLTLRDDGAPLPPWPLHPAGPRSCSRTSLYLLAANGPSGPSHKAELSHSATLEDAGRPDSV